MLRIRDVYTGSQIRIFPSRIQDPKNPGSASKNLSVLTQKKISNLLEKLSGMLSPYPGSGFFFHPGSWSRIQESKKHKSNGSQVPDADPQILVIKYSFWRRRIKDIEIFSSVSVPCSLGSVFRNVLDYNRKFFRDCRGKLWQAAILYIRVLGRLILWVLCYALSSFAR